MTRRRNILITGAGRDIGAAIARRLGVAGTFTIVHCANSVAGAEATLAAIRAGGGDGVVLAADFTDAAAVAGLVADAHAALDGGRLDILVLNAAATAATPLGGTPVDALKAMLAVNVLAPQRIVDGLAPALADGAAVVALSVASARTVFSPDFAFFSATKAAVDVLVKGWAVALGGRGIRVNAVAPGVVEVNFRADLLADAGFRAGLEAATALGRAGQVDDVAEVVAFLTSPAARWITGQVIEASGGWRL